MRRKLKLALLLSALGCRGSAPPPLGVFETSLPVQADVGGTIVVDPAEDSQLAGAAISIPAGALTADTTITLSTSPDASVALPGTQAAGPVLTFGPTGTILRHPATVSLPYALPTGSGPANLFAIELEDGGVSAVFEAGGGLVLDTNAEVMALQILTLGAFGPVAGQSCASAATCAPGIEACLDEICSGDLTGGVVLGCGVDGSCLVGETCDAGVCVGGFDGGAAPCTTSTDCPQTLPPQTCVDGYCVAE